MTGIVSPGRAPSRANVRPTVVRGKPCPARNAAFAVCRHYFLSMSATETENARVSTATKAAESAAAGGAEKREYVQRIFSEIAPRYDLLNHVLSLNVDKGWRRRAIAELDIGRSPRGQYLDLCAGTLDVAAQISRTAGFAGYVIGADFAEPMLRAGEAKLSGAKGSPVAADALQLPARDGGFAGAIVAFGIRNVANLDAALRETFRVLAPSGRFVILEFSLPRIPVLKTLYQTYFNYVLPFFGRAISGHRTAYTYLPKSVANFPVEEDLAARMRLAGFAKVRWTSLTFGVAAIHVGERAA
jgi:demethylmenaquinone methyltransferase/2-methoxy-6-polyprenyl-1,4-benzoquinol methylase